MDLGMCLLGFLLGTGSQFATNSYHSCSTSNWSEPLHHKFNVATRSLIIATVTQWLSLSSQPLGHRSTLASVRRCLRATSILGSLSCDLSLWTHGTTSARGWGIALLITSLGCCYKTTLANKNFLLQILQMNLAKPSPGATGTSATLLSLSARPEVKDLVEKSATQCVGGTTLPQILQDLDTFLVSMLLFVHLVCISKWSATQIYGWRIYDGLGRGKACAEN